MIKVTSIIFGLVAMSNIAVAGDPPKAPPANPAKPDMAKPAAKPEAAKPDMAKPDMAKPDMAKPAAKPEAAKPDTAKADPAKAGEAPKMAMPKPPQELADMAKSMSGTWKCTGKALGEDMKTMQDMKGTAKPKLAMNGYWLQLSYEAKMGKMPYRFESYITVDAASHQWRRVMVDGFGGQSVGTSTGPKDNKMDWNLESTGPMGASMFRDHEDWSDLKAGYKTWGEMSMDKGKTWVKVYEQICKK